MEALRAQLDGVLLFRGADDTRPVLTGVTVSDDGRYVVAADGFALALAPVTGGESLAGCVLDGRGLTDALRSFGRAGYASQVVTIGEDPGCGPGFVMVSCGGLRAHVALLRGPGVASPCSPFPGYLSIVASNPADPSLRVGASVDACVAVSALYLGRLGAAFKHFGPVLTMNRGRNIPVWFMATAADWNESRAKGSRVPAGSDFLLRVLVMPMFTVWPNGVEVSL